MKWYQQLFWKVFSATWLISVLLMGGLVYGLLRANETHHWQMLMETRAAGYAQLIIERQDSHTSDGRRTEMERARGRMLIRITDIETGQVIQDFRRSTEPGELIQFELNAENGRAYRVEMPTPEQPMHLDRMLRFLLSIQMVLILVMSTVVALWVSFWVVKPINRLRLFARSLHDEHNLASRTDSQLSARKDEIGELAREFDVMASYVEKTLLARQQLLRDVSHELRAPLARMQVATAILEQQSGTQDNPLLMQLNRESEQLGQLIDQLLSLSRLDDLSLQTTEPVILNTLLESIRDNYLLIYPDHQVNIETTPADLTVRINRALLERIVANLLENALKYSPAGRCVQIESVVQQHSLLMTVSDQGKGLDEEHLDKIFEPFYRVSEEIAGYGLGLSIVKNAVRRLQGDVFARNNAMGGVTVTVKLPLLSIKER